MNSIIETASSGESKSALKNVKEFDLQEGNLAVQNYHERLQAAGKNYLEGQAAFAGEKIEFYVQEKSVSKFDKFKVARWSSVFMRDFEELDGGTPLHHLVPSLFSLIFSGLIMFMISLQNKETPLDAPFSLFSIVLGIVGGFWTLWVLFVSLSEARFVRKTGYLKRAVDQIASGSVSVAAFTEKFVFFSHKSSNGNALCFKRHAFNIIKRVVRSDDEGETLLKAYDEDGNRMFALRGSLTPEGIQLEAELEKRIQNARNAKYTYRIPDEERGDYRHST